MRSQTSCTSASRWLHMTIVLPSSRRRRISPFISLVWMGSSPLVGSSRKINVRVVDQGLGQADQPGHALRVFLQLPPLRPAQPDQVDQVGRPLPADRPRHVEQPPVEIQRLLGVEEAVEVRLLGQVADPLVLGHFGGLAAEDQGLAAGGEQEPQEELDRGRLARAVRARAVRKSRPWRTSRSRAFRARTFCRPQKSR